MSEHWFSIQLKPVGNMCNLRCKYCYARPHASGEVMSYDVLEQVIKKTLQQDYLYPTFSWHGGEPTLAGYDFFYQAMLLIEKYKRPNQVVRNLIQTNATRITPQLAKLFKKYNFIVSISLDGPEHIHGINRVTGESNNSFSQVMDGIKILRQYGIEPSVICTVSRETLPFAAEVFHFLISQGFKKIKYSPVFDSTRDEFSITSDEWYRYLKTVFYEWFKVGDATIQIRDLNEVIAWLLKRSINLCSCNRTCLHWVSIDPKGEIYPCEYLREKYYYGNITQIEELRDIYYTSSYQEFKKIYETVPLKCRHCEFFKVCGNGCPATRVRDGKISLDGVYAFCEQRRKLFYEIEKVFKSVLGENYIEEKEIKEKEAFVHAVISNVKEETENMKPDDWRALLHNWIKC